MNHALALRQPSDRSSDPTFAHRASLIAGIACLLASAVSLAPTLMDAPPVQQARPTSPQVCKCAHCPGGANCCCRLAHKCLAP